MTLGLAIIGIAVVAYVVYRGVLSIIKEKQENDE